MVSLLSGCEKISSDENNVGTVSAAAAESETVTDTESHSVQTVQTGVIAEQILDGDDGEIHYSYYLPDNYDSGKSYPLVMTMPGYDRMWFGEQSSGSNLNWNGFLSWTKLDEEMIVASAQLTDWGEKSARQAIELTEYFTENFSVNTDRIYAAGYSAGGETMSRAVSMRPDLFAAYLHGASQWDGTFEPVAENGVFVYIFMAENDEYYGSQRARDAYDGLREAYSKSGVSEEDMEDFIRLDIPDDNYFNSRGIYNYHGGGNIVFDDEEILKLIIQK
ncbi:MAG: prolyl oligopeptidase family serine peptidase [Oscillospiraceae bacterium]|nr:prolyl oligopeptidase family serine peptidase [Oscillospiraceae bacterium]